MTEKRSQAMRLRTRTLGFIGAAAFVSLGALSLGFAHDGSNGATLAGSGDAPADTTFVQPSENAMNMGATATFTTPDSVAPTAKAVPSSSAG